MEKGLGLEGEGESKRKNREGGTCDDAPSARGACVVAGRGGRGLACDTRTRCDDGRRCTSRRATVCAVRRTSRHATHWAHTAREAWRATSTTSKLGVDARRRRRRRTGERRCRPATVAWGVGKARGVSEGGAESERSNLRWQPVIEDWCHQIYSDGCRAV